MEMESLVGRSVKPRHVSLVLHVGSIILSYIIRTKDYVLTRKKIRLLNMPPGPADRIR